MTDSPWSKYEREICAELEALYHDATVRHDVRLPGGLSGIERQIDVLVEERIGEETVRTAVESKCYSRRLDVKAVEEFIGMLRDVGVDRGVMVSPLGYTEAALQRAFADDVDLDLDILSRSDLLMWQSQCAIPYADSNGVFIPAPFGWVIDITAAPGTLAWLFRRGQTRDQAIAAAEFMYVNISEKREPFATLESLIAAQNERLILKDADTRITSRTIPHRRGRRAVVRRALLEPYPGVELTGFIEFDTFIFFAVMFTPPLAERRNTRKLEYMLGKAVPGHLVHPSA